MNGNIDQLPTHRGKTRRETIGWLGRGVVTAVAAFPVTRAQGAMSSARFSVSVKGQLAPGRSDVILVPGLASSPLIWTGLTTALPGHRYHLIHVAGFAGKPAGINGRGPLLEPLANDLARYAAQPDMHRPAIIGHSMGGSLGMMAALRAQQAVNRVMVVDMLPEGSAMLGGTAQGFGYLANQLNGYLTGTKAGRQILADMVMRTPGAEGSDPAVIAEALTELASLDLTKQLARLACPLTVVHALAGDAQTQARQNSRYRTAYAGAANARLEGIGPSGHMVMLDQPAKFAAQVEKFLK